MGVHKVEKLRARRSRSARPIPTATLPVRGARIPSFAGAAVAGLAMLVSAGTGCGRTMTEADCRRVADHMREVWAAEAKKAAPKDGAAAERAAAVVKSEGEKVVSDWSAECEKELQGRRVDAKELDCLLAAKTIEEINGCAELK